VERKKKEKKKRRGTPSKDGGEMSKREAKRAKSFFSLIQDNHVSHKEGEEGKKKKKDADREAA